MGAKLLKFYEDAVTIGGIEARVALAKLTGISSLAAITSDDSSENIEKFEKAIQNLKDDFKDSKIVKLENNTARASPESKKLINALARLQAEKPLFIGSISEASKKITKISSDTMNIARVSIWFINKELKAIECIDLYEQATKGHTSGLKLFEKDFPAYFKALEFNRAINAYDANNDYRTSCFSESYLKPLGINSMLDIPIWQGKEMKGVICNEHIGEKRKWTADEADFGVGLASILSEVIK
jgi:GAF domain-containing protein